MGPQDADRTEEYYDVIETEVKVYHPGSPESKNWVTKVHTKDEWTHRNKRDQAWGFRRRNSKTCQW